MECPYHAGSEAISFCIQCQRPICPLCSVETGQPVLCIECYRARVVEITGRMSGEPAASPRKPAVAERGAGAPAPPGEAPSEAVLDKKELKRLKKEEARRLKEERKRAKEEAKRLKKAREKQVEVPPAEGAGLFEEAPAAPEPPAAPWAGPTPSVAPEDSLAEERKPSLAGSEEMPLGFPSPPPSGVKLPRIEERLEEKPRPPEEIPLDLEPPEGFFE